MPQGKFRASDGIGKHACAEWFIDYPMDKRKVIYVKLEAYEGHCMVPINTLASGERRPNLSVSDKGIQSGGISMFAMDFTMETCTWTKLFSIRNSIAFRSNKFPIVSVLKKGFKVGVKIPHV